MHSIVVASGYALDLAVGDPQWKWHPVRIIGRLIQSLETILNKGDDKKALKGRALVILVVGSTLFLSWAALKLANSLHPVFYYILSAVLIYFALSVKSLAVETNKVYAALKAGDIQEARRSLSMIVGRDTDKLSEKEIIRAAVETVAESAMDGIIAPLFYAFLGGPVFAWGYKAINTLDSMVGHRTERYINFGRASAKLDSAVNFIPAKITCLAIFLGGFSHQKKRGGALKWVLKYFLKGPRYNSESTEAALAAVLGVQLGGLNFYGSAPVQKNLIGDNLYPLDARHIKQSIRIACIASALFVVMGTGLSWLIR
ncbi:MAG: cobalamin biosynthesis protein CobD [Candidatus Omnitrophica bacterium]|nr:cobalamin biosynthesis protein CobD [Candidatus Omnitrophota bacterium]